MIWPFRTRRRKLKSFLMNVIPAKHFAIHLSRFLPTFRQISKRAILVDRSDRPQLLDEGLVRDVVKEEAADGEQRMLPEVCCTRKDKEDQTWTIRRGAVRREGELEEQETFCLQGLFSSIPQSDRMSSSPPQVLTRS
jgi:hypothetical protein